MSIYLRLFCSTIQNLFIRFKNCSVKSYSNGCKCFKEKERISINQNSDFYFKKSQLIKENNIEDENFFRAVDRKTAEVILINRKDGSCLVRPYKEINNNIKYVISLYAKKNFFHLFIRQTYNGKYSIGLEKPIEKHFDSPNDIIEYYKLNKLLCTNKSISLSLVLNPIS